MSDLVVVPAQALDPSTLSAAPPSRESLLQALGDAEAAMRAGRVEEALSACLCLMPELQALGDRVAHVHRARPLVP